MRLPHLVADQHVALAAVADEHQVVLGIQQPVMVDVGELAAGHGVVAAERQKRPGQHARRAHARLAQRGPGGALDQAERVAGACREERQVARRKLFGVHTAVERLQQRQHPGVDDAARVPVVVQRADGRVVDVGQHLALAGVKAARLGRDVVEDLLPDVGRDDVDEDEPLEVVGVGARVHEILQSGQVDAPGRAEHGEDALFVGPGRPPGLQRVQDRGARLQRQVVDAVLRQQPGQLGAVVGPQPAVVDAPEQRGGVHTGEQGVEHVGGRPGQHVEDLPLLVGRGVAGDQRVQQGECVGHGVSWGRRMSSAPGSTRAIRSATPSTTSPSRCMGKGWSGVMRIDSTLS